MVKGNGFMWAHLGKTGGNSVHRMFEIADDGTLEIDDVKDPSKHRTFPRQRGDEVRLLSIRRLPEWITSHNLHMARHAGLENPYDLIRDGKAWLKGEAVLADSFLETFQWVTVDGWLRTEYLAEDFLKHIAQFTVLTQDQKRAIRSVRENAMPSSSERRDLEVDVIDRIYRTNPLWHRLEQQLY